MYSSYGMLRTRFEHTIHITLQKKCVRTPASVSGIRVGQRKRKKTGVTLREAAVHRWNILLKNLSAHFSISRTTPREEQHVCTIFTAVRGSFALNHFRLCVSGQPIASPTTRLTLHMCASVVIPYIIDASMYPLRYKLGAPAGVRHT